MQGVTVTLIRVTRSGISARGNDVLLETPEEISGCAFQPQQTSEQTQGAEEIIASAKVWFPVGTPTPTFADKVTYEGRTYQVDGLPKHFVSPWSGIQAPLQVELREVEGVTAHSSGGGNA
jgi:hypothetical protein